MLAMTPEQTWDFLMTETRTAKVATVRADGRPHVKPVWFEPAGQPGAFQLLFTTDSRTVTGRDLSRDPRVAVSVDDPAPLYSLFLSRAPRNSVPTSMRSSRWRPGWAAGTWVTNAPRSTAPGTGFPPSGWSG